MADVFQRYRRLCANLDDAVRWACALEAMAPKLGNVHPSARFADLEVRDFLSAGEILARQTKHHHSVGKIVLSTVRETCESFGTNINLGIALLIAPLTLAKRNDVEVGRVLEELSQQDAGEVYEAIKLARPGGLGESKEMDVRESPPCSLLAAMKFARDRDLIAKQYADNFSDVYEIVVPAIIAAVENEGDMLLGIRVAQIEILSKLGDTLIARKCGAAASVEVRERAAAVMSIDNPEQQWRAQMDLDGWMRGDGNRRNPGSTADLIAAGLFVLLS